MRAQWAYIAGLFDAEITITFRPRSPRRTEHYILTWEKPPVQLIPMLQRYGFVKESHGPNRSKVWRLYRLEGHVAFLKMVEPHLLRKREEVSEALDFARIKLARPELFRIRKERRLMLEKLK